ncbi:DUF896 domain-containing protein [Bacillus subtilis]|uniref:DUF896 domain-containing protein n=1 Tax=Bacillus subtilis TaxID=1423 RepID=UPI002FFDEAD1
MNEILNRINNLSRLEKSRSLTKQEKEEQKLLRQQYIEIFKGSLDSILLNTTIIDPIGNDVTPHKLKIKQKEMKK